jgi:hypothetical protein
MTTSLRPEATRYSPRSPPPWVAEVFELDATKLDLLGAGTARETARRIEAMAG